MKKLDLVNKRFGRLLVISESHVDRHGKYHWNVKCDCGNNKTVSGGSMKKGVTN